MKQPFRDHHLILFLRRFDQDRRPLDAALHDYLKSHKSIGAHDRRFIGDTAYALIRWKGLLNHLLGGASTWEEKISLLQRLDTNDLPSTLPAWVRCGSSEFLFQELTKDYGTERAEELSLALNKTAPVTARANLLKTTREELLSQLESAGVLPCTLAPTAFRFKKRQPISSLEPFKRGLFEIQDEGSQLVADLVGAKAGDQVLDYCSGSGGKSLAIAPKLRGKGQMYLHDIRPHILKQARERLCRAGVQNGQFLPPGHPRLSRLKQKMDWVLADVPCSGSGTLRRNPDMKWNIDKALLERLAQEQQMIFSEALDYTKPGGQIVYATCSLFKRENEAQVEQFLLRHPVELVKEPLLIFPEDNGPDGFFAAVFCKKK